MMAMTREKTEIENLITRPMSRSGCSVMMCKLFSSEIERKKKHKKHTQTAQIPEMTMLENVSRKNKRIWISDEMAHISSHAKYTQPIQCFKTFYSLYLILMFELMFVALRNN